MRTIGNTPRQGCQYDLRTYQPAPTTTTFFLLLPSAALQTWPYWKCQVRSVRWSSDVCQRRLLPLRPASVLRSHGWLEVYVAQAQHVVNRNANEA